MCAIAGFISYRDPSYSNSKIIENMLSIMSHRGPDARGEFIHKSVTLGHARLSIIDLSSSANQPFLSENCRYSIVYNGEIYNFKELRAELERQGFSFHTNSDTEVVLKSYIFWGTNMLRKLNGMFALAIYDKESDTIFFARDRYGIKPLYYYQKDGVLIFASEIKAIELHPNYSFNVDTEGLREYFSFQNLISESTLNDNVKTFPAGHHSLVNCKNNTPLKLEQYWDFEFQEIEYPLSEEECIEELDHLFQKAVKRQLVSDVPIGSYLSGGMDSGSITAIAAKELPDIHTFTCGFDMSSASSTETHFDERIQAQEFSDYFGTHHHEKIITSMDMERSIPTIAWHLDEPRVGQSYPNFYAAELARSRVTVVMSGTGGDELFAGYPWRYYRSLQCKNIAEYLDTYYEYWQRLVPESQHNQFFEPIWSKTNHYSPRDSFENVYNSTINNANNAEDFINQSLYFEAKTFLHGLLIVEDKLSMAHSLESRVPMLDNDLVDFAQKIPSRFKLGNIDVISELYSQNKIIEAQKYFQRSKDGKITLRKAMQGHLPKETSKREKQGFSGPDSSWFSENSRQFILNELSSKNNLIYDFLNKKMITNLLENHFSKQTNSRLLIWSLLNFSCWLRNHV